MFNNNVIQFLVVKILPGLASLLLASIIVSPKPVADAEQASLDAASYLAHAFTIGLDFDLNYENEPYDRKGYFNTETGLPSHPIGPGLLAAPFVAVFSVVDRFLGNPVVDDHNEYIYSWSRFGFYFSGILYFFLGIWLYRDLARTLAPRMSPLLVLIPALGSGVVYYVYHDGYLGHSFQFFSFALVVWASGMGWLNTAAGKPAATYLLTSAFAVALSHLIRPADLNVVLLPFLTAAAISVFHVPDKPLARVWQAFSTRYVFGLVIALTSLSLAYLYLYDTPFPLPSDMYGAGRGDVKVVSDLRQGGVAETIPIISKLLGRLNYLPDILFSSEFGVFYTSPLIPFGLGILFLGLALSVSKKPLGVAAAVGLVLAYVALPVAVVLHWQTTASAYGWRYLFSLLAAGYVGLMATHVFWISRRRAKVLYQAFLISLLALSLVGILSQSFWGTSSRLHFHIGENVFGVYHGTIYEEYPCCSGLGYLTKLSEDITKPSAWASMFAHRMPGYFVASALDGANVDLVAFGQRFGIPVDKLQAGAERYASLPPSVTIQLLLAFGITTFGIWYMGFSRVNEGALRARRLRDADA